MDLQKPDPAAPNGKLSEDPRDGSLDHLIHPAPLSHEFRFGTRGLLLLMLFAGLCLGIFRLGCHFLD